MNKPDKQRMQIVGNGCLKGEKEPCQGTSSLSPPTKTLSGTRVTKGTSYTNDVKEPLIHSGSTDYKTKELEKPSSLQSHWRGINSRKPSEGIDENDHLNSFIKQSNKGVTRVNNQQGETDLDDSSCTWCVSKPCLCDLVKLENNSLNSEQKRTNKEQKPQITQPKIIAKPKPAIKIKGVVVEDLTSFLERKKLERAEKQANMHRASVQSIDIHKMSAKIPACDGATRVEAGQDQNKEVVTKQGGKYCSK